jgi:hypothetical protein
MIKNSVIKIFGCALVQLILLVALNPVYASEIQNPNAIYEMYKTENIYHVLKLNTRTGQITQVQIGVGKDGWAMENTVNSKSLVPAEEEQNGRFALYPTGNMYNFVLLDRISGKVWQAQWSTKPENRGILPIN